MNESTLIKDISKHLMLSQEEISIFKNFWIERTFQKGDFLLRNGDVSRYDNFVVSGVLKAFYINSGNGKEEILYFAIDNWWASDLASFAKQEPSIYNIQAIEKTTVLQINYHSFQNLLLRIPALERYFRIILEGYLGALQRRIIENNVYDAEYRYFEFLKMYPDIASKIPQYLIASYLGVSPEFISRIRKKNKRS